MNYLHITTPQCQKGPSAIKQLWLSNWPDLDLVNYTVWEILQGKCTKYALLI